MEEIGSRHFSIQSSEGIEMKSFTESQNLKALLEPQGRIITFISDRGVGLLKAFDLIFPGNPHLYCYHHLRYNLSRKYKNKRGEIVVADVLQKFFKVAYASTEKSFYFHLKNLRDEGGAATIDEFIREIPLEHWCRAFFKGCRYGIMANGIAESFNNWIVAERSLPPFAMLNQTRMKEMKMMPERSVESKSWTTKLTPKMEKRLKEQLDRSRVFRVIASHENVYEVRNDKYSYSVDLSIQGARLDVYDFIDPYFTAEYYRMCYSFPIAPLSKWMPLVLPLRTLYYLLLQRGRLGGLNQRG
ncbi:PREDICTED: uncharacterized protein LOC101312874 [Fragaria vesca subsp. vesca]|uniref:uncharacterized protein LOC101312874 n=1 Tax=Fragaria vesca subsp. vesca TaxID=101020 RepID=UPI0002C35926|nr:PREDICTED: uncharacterized protein LOC101312874 [Fragaria vesca subsp. vesca]